MPAEWTPTPTGEVLHLWPHRSLKPEGFVWFIGVTASLLGLTLLAVVGSVFLWGLLPFAAAAIAAIWIALRHNLRAGQVSETLTLIRHDPGQSDRIWTAHRHWARIEIDPTAPVPHYLTLHGGPRIVELGAFLTPGERQTLYTDMRARLRSPP